MRSFAIRQKTNIKRLNPGDIVEVPILNGKYSYAQVGPSPLFVFFDGVFEQRPSAEAILPLNILFKLWLHKDALRGDRWKKLSSADLSPENMVAPPMRKQDVVSGRLFIHHSDYADSNYEKPATLSEIENLETAAVWDIPQVEQRIEDHYLGKPNKWEEALKIKLERVPIDQLK
ncbi:MAG: Imm26 family immunity protein [Parasphingorhabdus sp.]|uniref:Imm26 family immunity protein n=1 Tax=Parasphingorhabdus sp. TaxID=2709688 RepID=UPI003298AD49